AGARLRRRGAQGQELRGETLPHQPEAPARGTLPLAGASGWCGPSGSQTPVWEPAGWETPFRSCAAAGDETEFRKSNVPKQEFGNQERRARTDKSGGPESFLGAVLLRRVLARGLSVVGHLLLQRVTVDPQPLGGIDRHVVAGVHHLLD